MRRSSPASRVWSSGGQLGQQRLLLLDEVGHRGVHDVAARRREAHDDAATVAGVGAALDVAAAHEPVDPGRHRARRDEGLLHELAGGELVGLAGTAQRGEHVEGPAVELVHREGGAPGEVEAAGQPADPREHLERG